MDSPLIVVLGRSDAEKRSASIDALIEDLRQTGLDVLPFTARSTQTYEWLQERFARITGPRFPGFAVGHPVAGSVTENVIKAAVLMTRPSRWDYFSPRARDPMRGTPRELRRLIRAHPGRRVFFVSHSAGGIIASRVDSDSVRGLVCFGYPFKHPSRAEEPYRTAHLARMTKPFLIVQGDEDEYGSAADARRYTLSPSILVMPVSATHDYADLPEDQYRACRTAILALIGNAAGPTDARGIRGEP